MKIRNNLFVLRTLYCCHLCHREQLVIALATSDLYENAWLPTSEEKVLFLFCDVTLMPSDIVDLIRSLGCTYEQRKSSVGRDTCFGIWCINCGTLLRDLYLVGLPSGPFSPETVAAADAIELLEIPLATELAFEAAYSKADGELIRQHARDFRNLRRPNRISPTNDRQW
jgi:hypothetical protein